MMIRRNWADRIALTIEENALIAEGLRFDLPEADLFDEGYARTKTDRTSEPLYLEISALTEAAGLQLGAARYGPIYGDLVEYSSRGLDIYLPQEASSKIVGVEGKGSTTRESRLLPHYKVVVRQRASVGLAELAAIKGLLSIIDAIDRHVLRRGLTPVERKDDYRAIAAQLTILAEQTRHWPHQLARERLARKQHYLDSATGWSWTSLDQSVIEIAQQALSRLASRPDERLWLGEAFSESPLHKLKSVVSTVLNAFPARLTWHNEEMIQHPGADLIFGIRPLVYHMIREDLLSRFEIRLCRSKSCGRFFRASRRDQSCCSTECSERVRSQKHYETKRKPARQKLKPSKVAN